MSKISVTTKKIDSEVVNQNNSDKEVFCFLYDLINDFCKQSNITYFSILKLNKELQSNIFLKGLILQKDGLIKIEPLLETYAKAEKGKTGIKKLYVTAPIIASFSRFLSSVIKEVSYNLGEKKASNLLQTTYLKHIKIYKFEADVEKFFPNELKEKKLFLGINPVMTFSAVDNLITYLLSNIMVTEKQMDQSNLEDKQTLKEIYNLIGENKITAFAERNYLSVYLKIEGFLISHQPPDIRKKYTRESLRGEIRLKYNLTRFPAKLSAIITNEHNDSIVYLILLLEQILKNLVKKSNPNEIQKLVVREIIINNDKINFDIYEKKIFELAIGELELSQKSVENLILKIFTRSSELLGQRPTVQIFEDAYKDYIKEFDQNIDAKNVLSNIPKGILESEKFELLSKEELEKAAKKIREIDILKDEFMNMAAHELKTPLIPIIGYLDMILKDKNSKISSEERKQLTACLIAANREKDLVNDVLDISKLEAGTMKINIQHFDLIQFLTNVVDGFKPMAKEKKIELKTSFPNRKIFILGDSMRFTQVIANLLSNSIKFTSKGSVTVKLIEKDSRVYIKVIDTGVGIGKEFMPRLFKKFQQEDSSWKRKFGGTGLGLHLSKHIVELHRGEIWAESRGKNKGSTFTISLSAKQPPN